MAGRSIRLLVRTRKRYEPTYFECPLWHIDVTDFAGCSVGDIKRKCHKETDAKVEDLFYLNQSLADDRSVAHYNFPDGAILETTSNPLWAAMIHVKMVEIERERDAHPNDKHVQRWTHKSFTKKTTLLSVLFNAKKVDRVQPPNFPTYEDLVIYLERLGRKGANINPNYSGRDFTLWFDEYLQLDAPKADPIRAFQRRHAARLSLNPQQGQLSGIKTKKNSSGGSDKAKSKGKQPMRRATATATRPRQAWQARLCEDCEETEAEIYCSSCVGPGGSAGVVLCMVCTHRIHKGALRGGHDCQDISQAPKPSAGPKQYLPHPYKSPFAVLLAMTRALKENRHKLSLDEGEIKQRAQPLTDTDLQDKPYGKMMGGFDCIENTLIPKQLVQKEAADRHTYALTKAGRELGHKLDIFDEVLQQFLADSRVPQPPETFRSWVNEHQQVILVMDSHERDAQRMGAIAKAAGVTVLVRPLQVGDYVWVLSPGSAADGGDAASYDGSRQDEEVMLPVLVERKSWHDLHDSIRFGRWSTQINRMKACGLKGNFVLVEGCLTDLRQVSQARRDFLQGEVERMCVEEGFHVGRTFSWAKSSAWLIWMTHILTQAYTEGVFEGETIMFSELRSRVMRGERERRLGGVVRPVTSPGTSCVWEADQLLTAVFRDSMEEQEMAVTCSQQFPPADHRSLLVLHGTDVYNKTRQTLLLAALRQTCDVEPFTSNAVRGVIEGLLLGELKALVHFDVIAFWTLYLQVRHQVLVMRSETEEDSHRLLHWFSQGQSLPHGPLTEEEKKTTDREQPQDNVGWLDAGQDEDKHGILSHDFAIDEQSEEKMLQEALSLSLIESLNSNDDDTDITTTISLTTQHVTLLQHPPSSQPLFEVLPCNPPVGQLCRAAETQRQSSVQTRTQSPLGFCQDDPILIDSQGGMDDGGVVKVEDSCGVEEEGWGTRELVRDTQKKSEAEKDLRRPDVLLVNNIINKSSEPEGLVVNDWRDSLRHTAAVTNVADSQSSDLAVNDIIGGSQNAEAAGRLEEETAVADDCIRRESDEALARRLQEEENMMGSPRVTPDFSRRFTEHGTQPKTSLKHGEFCDVINSCDFVEDSQNNENAQKEEKNNHCTPGRAEEDSVTSTPNSHNRFQPLCVSTPQHHSASRKRHISSPSWCSGKKLKSQMEADEELARRLQRELDGISNSGSGGDVEGNDVSLMLGDDSQGEADVVDADAYTELTTWSQEDPSAAVLREEDHVLALQLQEEEMATLCSKPGLSSSVSSSLCKPGPSSSSSSSSSSATCVGDASPHLVASQICGHDSLLADEALARKLQEQEAEEEKHSIIVTDTYGTNHSSLWTQQPKKVLKSLKGEAAYKQKYPAENVNKHISTRAENIYKQKSPKAENTYKHKPPKPENTHESRSQVETIHTQKLLEVVKTEHTESDEALARRLQQQEEEEVRGPGGPAPWAKRSGELSRKGGHSDGSVDVSEEEDQRLALRLQEQEERGKGWWPGGGEGGGGREVQGQGARTGETMRPTTPAASVKKEKPSTTTDGVACTSTADSKPATLKEEPKPHCGVTEAVGLRAPVAGCAGPSNQGGSDGTRTADGGLGDVGSSAAHHQLTSATAEESASAPVASNVKCGSCGQKGHNRRFDRCPNYYTEKEKKRRDAMEEAQRRRAEERAREAVERQREEQRALARLAETRESLQRNKEEMMLQIAQATQQCAAHFQTQLNDIDSLITSKQRKLKKTPGKPNRQ